MYSRVKRRKSMRRNTFSMPTHHKVMSKTEQEEEEEEEGTEGQFPLKVLLMKYGERLRYAPHLLTEFFKTHKSLKSVA